MHARAAQHRPPLRLRARGLITLALLLALTGGLVPTSATAHARASAAPSPCRAADLDAAITHQGVTDTTLIHVGVATIQPDTECLLMGQPQLQLRDARDNLLVASPPPVPHAGEALTLSAGSGTGASFRWGNWCGSQRVAGAPPPIDGPITVLVILPGDAGQLLAHPAGTAAGGGLMTGGPPCLSPDKPSDLVPLGPFEAAPGTSFGPPGVLPFYVGAPFLAYWRTHGGLAILGYPLSRDVVARLEDGKTYTVQYFERARLEYHPENVAPNDVLLGQLGRAVHPAEPPVPAKNDPFFIYFPTTGHNVDKRFLGFWERNGGLPQFGYPLTDPFDERLADGNTYTVQYFERARFEYHPENAAPYDVLLGQLGELELAGAGGGR